jgi:hypothetical protein
MISTFLFRYHRISFLSLVVLCLLVVQSMASANAPVTVIVQVAEGVDVATLAADYDTAVTGALPSLDLVHLTGNDPQLANELAADPRVLAAHADSIIVGQPRLIGAVGGYMDAQPRLIGAVGDPDTDYAEQWAVNKLRLPQAHAISQGQDVTVAVLDTGVLLNHPLLVSQLVPGYDFVDDDAIPDEVTDGLDQDGDGLVDEDAGHGTHVAGTVLLVAPQAKIMPVRIFNDEGKGTYFDAIAGILFAVDNGADIINLSGSGADDMPFLADAIAYADAQGVVVVAAGGVNNLGYPAGYNSVISVGAADPLDYPTDFSNYPQMANTVYAPGIGIFSSYYDGDYAWWTGNSMATPLVSGTAALMLAAGGCNAACVQTTIIDTAHAVVIDPESQAYYGRIDTFDAVAMAANQFVPDFTVQLRNGHHSQPGDLEIKPHLRIVNNGNSVPLDELTLRYWYTSEGSVEEQLHCDYAFISCQVIESTFGVITETAVADTYFELSFTAEAGTLLGGHESGEIQLRVHKNNWTVYNELDDYSYNGDDNYGDWQYVTLYHNGQLVWGVEP